MCWVTLPGSSRLTSLLVKVSCGSVLVLFPACTWSFDTIWRVRDTCHFGKCEKVISAGWLPSVQERMLPLFGVRRDKVGTALSLLGPISSVPSSSNFEAGGQTCPAQVYSSNSHSAELSASLLFLLECLSRPNISTGEINCF